MTQYLAARLKRAGRRCTVQVAMSKRGVWLRHPLHLGKGCEHIQAGRLVKHLLVLRSGPDDWTAASQRIMQLSRFRLEPMPDGTGCQALLGNANLKGHRLAVSLSCD